MSKFEYKPNRINFGLSFIFTLVILYVSRLSTQVHLKNDNFYIVLTSKCCTVLCSTFTYYICTFTQYIIYYECLSIYKTYKNQKIILNSTDKTRDNTLQYTISSILLDSMDFTNSSTNRSIFISRSEMWRVFYIIPFLAIVVFFKFQSTIATVQLLFVLGCL